MSMTKASRSEGRRVVGQHTLVEKAGEDNSFNARHLIKYIC